MADIEFYRSNIDEFNPSNNGGSYTEIAESGVLNNLIPNVRALTAELGGERWFKFFIKANVDLINIGVDIARFSLSPTEEVYLALGGVDDVEADLDKANIRLYGGFLVTAWDGTTATLDRNVSDFVKSGDVVTFYDENQTRITAWVVDAVNNNQITFSQTSSADISNLYGSSTLMISELNATSFQGIWIKQVIQPYTEAMETIPDEFVINIWYEIK